MRSGIDHKFGTKHAFTTQSYRDTGESQLPRCRPKLPRTRGTAQDPDIPNRRGASDEERPVRPRAHEMPSSAQHAAQHAPRSTADDNHQRYLVDRIGCASHPSLKDMAIILVANGREQLREH